MNTSRIVKVVFAALIASVPAACTREEGKAKPTAEIQSDTEGLRASNGLIRLQESPVFPVDETKKPFAMIDDRADKVRAGDKPLRMEEQRSRQ